MEGKPLGHLGSVSIARLFNSIQEGESPNETPESEHLTKEDFEVPAARCVGAMLS